MSAVSHHSSDYLILKEALILKVIFVSWELFYQFICEINWERIFNTLHPLIIVKTLLLAH